MAPLILKLISNKMRNIYLIIILFISYITPGFGQKKSLSGGSSNYNLGIGVKLGDPTGITVKKSLGGGKALEFIFGRTHYWGGYYGYHHDYFYKWYDKKHGYYIVSPRFDRNRYRALAFQLHYLAHKDISQLKGLQWYVGIGGQVRTHTYYYQYYDNYWRDERFTRFSFGLDGIIGLEYTFEELPLTLGLDINLYIEALPDPFFILGQGGLAIRYNF